MQTNERTYAPTNTIEQAQQDADALGKDKLSSIRSKLLACSYRHGGLTWPSYWLRVTRCVKEAAFADARTHRRRPSLRE